MTVTSRDLDSRNPFQRDHISGKTRKRPLEKCYIVMIFPGHVITHVHIYGDKYPRHSFDHNRYSFKKLPVMLFQNLSTSDEICCSLSQGDRVWDILYTLPEFNISPFQGNFESMVFLFQRWDMLVFWRVGPCRQQQEHSHKMLTKIHRTPIIQM